MIEIIRMQSVEPVLNGVLKIVWLDGFSGIVDVRSIISKMDMFAFLRSNYTSFEKVCLEEHGHKIFWLDDDGDEVDLGTQSLRERAERQAEILRLAS